MTKTNEETAKLLVRWDNAVDYREFALDEMGKLCEHFEKALKAKDAEFEKRIKEALPGKRKWSEEYECERVQGFNKCRNEFINNLNLK